MSERGRFDRQRRSPCETHQQNVRRVRVHHGEAQICIVTREAESLSISDIYLSVPILSINTGNTTRVQSTIVFLKRLVGLQRVAPRLGASVGGCGPGILLRSSSSCLTSGTR
jgi:hypothetical protein